LALVKIEANEADLITALIDAGLLDVEAALNPEVVANAASRALARWIIPDAEILKAALIPNRHPADPTSCGLRRP